MCKIDKYWIFDTETNKLYHVVFGEDDKVERFIEAFNVEKNERTNKYVFKVTQEYRELGKQVPFGIIRKVGVILDNPSDKTNGTVMK